MAIEKFLGEKPKRGKSFPELAKVLEEFQTREFLIQIDRKRSERVNRALLHLIQSEKEPCFLLPQVLDFVAKVDRKKILHHYSFASFELWLNQYSGLNFEENFQIRARIAGKKVDRSDYQLFFPVGMGKVYDGTHFVTAHKSPDLDTTIASFWGWLDAFAARVSYGLHVWNLPGGPPASQIEVDWLFRDLFGPAVFSHLAKTRTALNLTGNDLMSQSGLQRKTLADSIALIDHERDHNAVVIVDDEGFYLGDWRNYDVEGVRQVIILLSSCLRWFENSLHLQLISLLAKRDLRVDDVPLSLQHLFDLKVRDCEPALEFSLRQTRQVEDLLTLVLGIKKGLKCTFEELGFRLARLGDVSFDGLDRLVGSMKGLFDHKGKLLEERPRIFAFLEKAVRNLHEVIFKIRERMERIDIALKTKTEVFGHHPTFVTIRSDVEEIRNKMASYPYLTVNYPDKGKMYPVGAILASDLRKEILGTVSLRDFCNRDEMGIPPYLDVISVIDHHKSQISTSSPPMAIIADAQSSNALVADRTFQLNDRYSLGGRTPKQIRAELKIHLRKSTPEASRLVQRLLKRRLAAECKGDFFIHPEREYIEYLHFLYAILDDTDLLSKVTVFDVECVASLLNRLKSLAGKKELEIISLDDLPRDQNFAKRAAQKILKNEEMYLLYREAYFFREKEIERNISLCVRGKGSNFFSDTKEQNGCCRIGQTKLFASNIPLFQKHADKIRRLWVKAAQGILREKSEIDLHLHMTSTLVSAEDVYQGISNGYAHQDELWIWIPPQESAIEHLKRFLSAFQSSPALKENPLEVEFLGPNREELALIFKESFFEIPQKRSKKELPIAVLRFKAGSLNSRKAMVSPFLPSLS